MKTTELVNKSISKSLTPEDVIAKNRFQAISERQRRNEELRSYALRMERKLGL